MLVCMISRNVSYLHVIVSKIQLLEWVSNFVGWIYFLAWSVSFYPQIYTNYKRKRWVTEIWWYQMGQTYGNGNQQWFCSSVVGLNFDFIALNIVGFVLYSAYNCGLYYVPAIQVSFSLLYLYFIGYCRFVGCHRRRVFFRSKIILDSGINRYWSSVPAWVLRYAPEKFESGDVQWCVLLCPRSVCHDHYDYPVSDIRCMYNDCIFSFVTFCVIELTERPESWIISLDNKRIVKP